MPGFQCATCGEFHEELPLTLGPNVPALCETVPKAEWEQRVLLGSDQCIVDERHFFIRARLQIPVIDGEAPFTWLVWASVSEQDFDRASELWEQPGRESEPPCRARVQSHLPYDPTTLNLAATLKTMPVGERPLVRLEPSGHPLYAEQAMGITMARVREIVEGALHAT